MRLPCRWMRMIALICRIYLLVYLTSGGQSRPSSPLKCLLQAELRLPSPSLQVARLPLLLPLHLPLPLHLRRRHPLVLPLQLGLELSHLHLSLPPPLIPEARALVKDVFNSQSADFRSLHQYQVLWQFVDRRLNFINVAATGSGKTLPLHLACHWWGDKSISVLCQGFIVLYGEMEARAKTSGLDVMVYQSAVKEDISGQQLLVTSVHGFPPQALSAADERSQLEPARMHSH